MYTYTAYQLNIHSEISLRSLTPENGKADVILTLGNIKDLELSLDQTDQSFQKVESAYNQLVPEGADIKISSDPKFLYETRRSFLAQAKEFNLVEFGRRAYLKTEKQNLKKKLLI